MQDLYIPGFECSTTTNSIPKRKRKKIKKKGKGFHPNIDELFHGELHGSFPTAGKTPLPVLEPTKNIYPTRLVPFNEAYANKDYNCTVHFYIDDKLFLRVLRKPEKYLAFFQKCHSVIGPDLSQYINMSYEERYYCAYINRAFTAYLQRNGVNVIINVTWSLPDSYEYSTTGIPQHSVVAINCTGILKYNVSKYLWRKGYNYVCEHIDPLLIVRYGDKMPCEDSTISLHFENERIKRLRYGSER